MVKTGNLTLSVAASRDQVRPLLSAPRKDAEGDVRQEEKIYVQHRIKQYATLVWTYLQDSGIVYLCGSVLVATRCLYPKLTALPADLQRVCRKQSRSRF